MTSQSIREFKGQIGILLKNVQKDVQKEMDCNR